MKRSNEPYILRLFSFTIFTMMIVLSSYSQGFQIRGYDIGRITDVNGHIDDAAANGMNLVTFSHDVIMDRNIIEADPSKFEGYASRAAAYGMESYFWNHAFYAVPSDYKNGTALDFDNPDLWTWLRGVYRDIFTDVPSMTGVVISFTEGDSYQIHRDGNWEPEQSLEDIDSQLEPAERIEKYISELYAELSSMGKKLIIRDFWRSNTEGGYLREALNNLPTDIMVYSKHKANDFRYGYPTNMGVGAYPERIQILEIEIAQADPYYYQREYQIAYEAGVQGILPRWREDGGEFRDLNNKIYNEIADDVYKDITPIILGEGYSANDAQALSHFMECYIKANYVWGFYLGKHMYLEETKYPSRLYRGEGREMYTKGDDETNDNTRKIRGLTSTSYGDAAKQEKDDAETDALYWKGIADNSALRSEFQDVADFATIHGSSIRDFINDNYSRVQSGNDECPLPPSNVQLQVNPSDPNSIIITWDDNANNEDNYKIERQDGDGMMYQRWPLFPANTTSFTDYGLTPGVLYTYRIRAYADHDKRWNSPYSYNVSIQLGPIENVPPMVNISGPADGAQYLTTEDIVVDVNASDSDGQVSNVELFVNGNSNTNDVTAPYSFTLSGLGIGNYTLQVVATDDSSATTASSIVNVSVVNEILYDLTVTTQGNGAVNPSSGSYNRDEVILITATPDTDWTFVEWNGDATGAENPLSVTMDGPKNITAVFAPPFSGWCEDFELADGTQEDTGETAWTSTSSPTAVAVEVQSGKFVFNKPKSSDGTATEGIWQSEVIDVSSLGTFSLSVDVSSTLGIMEDSDYLKMEYLIDGGTVVEFFRLINEIPAQTVLVENLDGNSIQVIITAYNNNDAEFFYLDNICISEEAPPVQYSLSTSVVGSGTVNPANGTFNENEVISLQATANTGYRFIGWSGDATGTTNPLNIIMTSDKNITATFEIVPTYSLTTNVVGNGSVTPESGTFSEGEAVSITATATAGYVFTGWSGDVSGTANPVNVTMDANKNITATFIESQGISWIEDFNLADGTSSDNGVTAWSRTTPAGTAEVQGGQFYASNTDPTGAVWTSDLINIAGSVVDLSMDVSAAGPMEDSDYYIISYSIDGGAEIEIFNTLNSFTAQSVSASGITGNTLRITATLRNSSSDEAYYLDNVSVVTAGPVPQYTLTTSVSGNGSVSPSSATYNENDVVSLQASPDAGWVFTGWSGDASGTTNPMDITITSDLNITANFTESTGFTAWIEDFEGLASGTIVDNGATAWTSVVAQDAVDFGVQSGQYVFNKAKPDDGIWLSENIDISGAAGLSVSIDISSVGDFETGQDYLILTYIVDGVSTDFHFVDGGVGSSQAISAGLPTGTTLQVKVTAHNTASTEFYYIDNISVSDGSVLKGASIAQVGPSEDPKVYPNPASELINIEFEGTADVVIYNLQGKLVYKKEKVMNTLLLNAYELSEVGTFIIQVNQYRKLLVVE